MKKAASYLLGILLTATLVTSCKKDKGVEVHDTPKSVVPDELVGKWQIGNFNIAGFNNFSGTPQPNTSTTIAYNIGKDGNAEQYIYLNEGSKQTLTYRKGTISINEAAETWKFCPASGTFRIFQDGKKTQDAITAEGLYPKYAPAYRDCYLEEDNQSIYLGCTNDYNEDLMFKKVIW